MHTITCLDGSQITYNPRNKTYKILGVHINPDLHFREHFIHIAKYFRKLAKVISNMKLSPPNKKPKLKQLLKSKYHAIYLGVLDD
jgi:hypothetical protein